MEKKKKKIVISILIALSICIVFATEYFLAEKNGGGRGTYEDNTEYFIHKKQSIILKKLQYKEKGIYYFGFPTCPWCQELLPIFNCVLAKNRLKTYDVNTRGNTYTIQNNIILERFFAKYVSSKKD